MNLNSIVNGTLGLGNPLGPNMLMKECEPDFIAGGRAIALNSGNEDTPTGPNLEIGYCVAYDESSKIVTYYPKTVTFKIDDSGIEESAHFLDMDEGNVLSISADGKEVTIDVLQMYEKCKDGYDINTTPIFFTIDPYPHACIDVYANEQRCEQGWVQEEQLDYFYIYVDLFSLKTLKITWVATLC